MRISERQQQILKILEKDTFSTVQQLAASTFTSPSSIRRDLTALQTQGLVARTHGGATLSASDVQAPALHNRMSKNVSEKRKIAKTASSLLHDDMSVMLDGSSTASFLLPYLAEHKNIKLFTNNMTTAIRAIELGISTHCLGGKAVLGSTVLAGEETCRAVENLYVDILFFSSQYLDHCGVISDSTEEENHLRCYMLKCARRTVFLCDGDKFGKRALFKLTDLNSIDIAVFDRKYPELTAACEIMI